MKLIDEGKSQDLSELQACEAVGIDPKTVRNWRKMVGQTAVTRETADVTIRVDTLNRSGKSLLRGSVEWTYVM